MRALAAAAALALTACAGIPEPALYTNPVLARDFPDPAVLRAPDGYYYAYATQGEDGTRAVNVQAARSRDLVRWEYLGDALPAKPAWASRKQHFWAPHVLFDAGAGRYFLYYSAEPDDAAGKCLAVATASAPGGPFVDRGAPLLCGEGLEHIDPMAFDDPRTGKRLLYWGSGGKPIQVQELAPDRLGFREGSAPRALLAPDARPYRSLIEGAWIAYRDGWYYLYYSGDRCCTANPRYAVMVARARDALGPFEEHADPILTAGDEWQAPGHVAVVADDAGAHWLLFHAVRPGGAWAPRLLLLEKIHWREGWPRIAGQVPGAASQAAPAVANGQPAR